MKCLLAVMLGLSSTVAWGMDADDFRVLNELRRDVLQVLSNRRFLIPDQKTVETATEDLDRISERIHVILQFAELTADQVSKINAIRDVLTASEQPATLPRDVAEIVSSQRRLLMTVEIDLRNILAEEMTAQQRAFEKSKFGKGVYALRTSLIGIQNEMFGTGENFSQIDYDIGRWVERLALIEDIATDGQLKGKLEDIGRTMDERKALKHTFSNVPRVVAAYFDTVAQAIGKLDDLLKIEHSSFCETALAPTGRPLAEILGRRPTQAPAHEDASATDEGSSFLPAAP